MNNEIFKYEYNFRIYCLFFDEFLELKIEYIFT